MRVGRLSVGWNVPSFTSPYCRPILRKDEAIASPYFLSSLALLGHSLNKGTPHLVELLIPPVDVLSRLKSWAPLLPSV